MRKIIALSVVAYILAMFASSPAWAGWTWDEGRADTGVDGWVWAEDPAEAPVFVLPDAG